MGWVLIEGRLEPEDAAAYVARAREGCSKPDELFLPVLPSGRVHEIICLGREAKLDPRLTLRPLGRLERIVRMAWRVVSTWRRLTPLQWQGCGLSWRQVLFDLAGAYRMVSLFRGMSYASWVELVDWLSDSERAAMRTRISGWNDTPQFQILLLGSATAPGRAQTLASLERQVYRNFELISPNAWTKSAWLVLLHPGEQLAEQALYAFACAAQMQPEAALIYADDDELDRGMRCRPRLKPDWSPLHLQETDYIGRAAAFNGHALAAAGGLLPDNLSGDTWELLLRVGLQTGAVVRHVPVVLLHREAEQVRATPPRIRRVSFRLPPKPPLVSVIVPTRDAVALLRQCLDSLLEKTSYPLYEIVVIDNGSSDEVALAYLTDVAKLTNVRVLRDPRPFNYSALNNHAVHEARGEVLCLLNNDTEVITPDWLEEMVSHLLQERVGVVGAKLFYPDGRVQHAGDVVGVGGCANHLHAFIGADEPGYCNRAIVAQDLSAVTAACLVTWRELYLELGGLDEKNLPVAFNDVDYCLRVREAGQRVVWTPHAQLYHHESVSRGKDKSFLQRRRAKREVHYMRRRWAVMMERDPFYNPNFSYTRPDFVLSPLKTRVKFY